MLTDQAIARVRAYRRAMRWSVNRLATEAGMGESTIRRMDDPDWAPTTTILRQLEAVIPAGWKEPPSEAA